ncbi:MAG: hypothetical protein GYA87_06035 [Christensenellaceae bacterium]|nr:hypothetical protein [Christensenellaceae bacterium]
MKNNFEDDNRVIVDMNVEGMSWYNPNKTSDLGINSNLSKYDFFKLMLSSLKAALTIAAIFSIALIIFVIFCLKVWFKV